MTVPTLQDFEALLRRIGDEAVAKLGRVTASITADAAAKGALGGSRIVFVYLDALKEHWGDAAGNTMAELRRWSEDTKVAPDLLRAATERQLRYLLGSLVKASRVERCGSQFQNQEMLPSARDRVAALDNDLAFRLRQFDIGMDIPADKRPVPLLRKIGQWLAKHLTEIVITVIAALIIAALGAS